MTTAAFAVVRSVTNQGADFRFLRDGSFEDASSLLIYVFFFVFFVVLIQTLWLVRRLRSRRRFEDQFGANKDSRLRFFEDRVEANTHTSDSTIRWGGFRSFAENAAYFFLMLGPHYAIIVPKRCLRHGQGIDGLRALLERNLPRQQ